jgi:hypothetical protein
MERRSGESKPMNLITRLRHLEKTIEKMNQPTQEDAVCSYLSLILNKDNDLEELETNYNKVIEFLPKMHEVSP